MELLIKIIKTPDGKYIVDDTRGKVRACDRPAMVAWYVKRILDGYEEWNT